MRFMSLFSGVGGFDLGLERAGMECVAQCDNDPFCNKVLAKHWPGVKRYDDVSRLRFKRPSYTEADPDAYNRWRSGMGPGEYHQQSESYEVAYGGSLVASIGHVDLICGGFPCQDLSVAGKRAGLDGARSGLWFEFHRILSELRPTFCLIENVPGLLSSDSGRDFGVVLGGLGELWPAVGWVVLDSQHFGVAQRRRRVYVIGGPSRECVQQILSLCESGDWNTQAGRAQGQDIAATIRGRSSGAGVNEPGRGGEDDSNLVLANTLPGHHPRQDLDNDTYVAGTVTQRSGAHTGNSNPITDNLVLAHSLRADGFDASEDGTGRGTPLVAATLTGGEGRRGHRGDDGTDTHIVGMLLAPGSEGSRQDKQPMTVDVRGVRRLTPVECERLQGFPDDWTLLDERTADGSRYKALGNAVTVPVIEYIGRRIIEVLT